MYNIFKPLLKKFESFILKNFEKQKIQVSKNFFLNLELNLDKIENIDSINYKVFSQNGEDGIIQYLIKSLKLKKIKFVEIGTEDYSESNTRYIFETTRCDGLIIDPLKNLKDKVKNTVTNFWKNNLLIINDFASPSNINLILEKNNFNNNIDLFSIDIDGVDYWIIKELKKNISKIFVAEYNPYFGSKLEISAPNLEKFDRFKYHPSGVCWGASLKAMINLMKKKGYTFLGSNRLNCNSFFVLNELVDKFNINIPNIENLSEFTDVKFNALKTKDKKYASFSDIKNDIKNLEVFDLVKNKMVKFDEIS